MQATAPLRSSRVSVLRPTAVTSVSAEARQLQAQGKKLVSLMRGEPDLPTPAHIVQACTRAMQNGRTGYPDNRGEKNFREAVALKLERDNGLLFDPGTEILATTGATLGIYAALMALLDEGDEVLLPDPIYDAYTSPILLAGAYIKPVASRIENGRFVLTEQALEDAWSPAARVLLLNTPWNPVGTVLTRAELASIAQFCERRKLVLVSDEIYESLTYDGREHVSALAAAPELRERSILVNSLSKTYAMTGWRVGYCAGAASLIQAMFMVLMQSSRGPATFVQDAAAAALSGPQECVASMRDEYARRRDRVVSALSGIPRMRVPAPEGGFFAMADVRDFGLTSNEIRKRLLEEQGVVVIHGAAYGASAEGTLRISFASGGETLARGLDLLRQGLAAIAEHGG